MPRTVTVYFPSSEPDAWMRVKVREGSGENDYPRLVERLVDDLQARPTGQAARPDPPAAAEVSDPNLSTCRELTLPALEAYVASNAWRPEGAFVLGAHGSLFLDCCVGEAVWLEVRRQTEAVERMKRGDVPVLGVSDTELRPIDRASLQTARVRLRGLLDGHLHESDPKVVLQPGKLEAPAAAPPSSAPPTPQRPPVSRPAGPPRKGPLRATEPLDVSTESGAYRAWAERATLLADDPGRNGPALESWLAGWCHPPRATDVAAPWALPRPIEATQAVRDNHDQLLSALLDAAGAPTAVRAEGANSVPSVLAFAAYALDLALARVGLATRWVTLVSSTSNAHVGLPLPPPARGVKPGERIAPYAVSSLFSKVIREVHTLRRKEFALNVALRNELLKRFGDAGDEAWREQQLVPTVDLAAEWARGLATPASAPATATQGDAATLSADFPGLVAFTPFAEAWLLPTRDSARAYVEAAKRRFRTVLNQEKTWDQVGGYSNGKRWVPMLTLEQLGQPRPRSAQPAFEAANWRLRADGCWERADPDAVMEALPASSVGSPLTQGQISQYRSQTRTPMCLQRLDWKLEPTSQADSATFSVIPKGALPFAEDPTVREQAFRLVGKDVALDWIHACSPVGFAFKDKRAEKVLLPSGMRLYKFNSDPRLFFPMKRGTSDATDPYATAVSPWWSPIDGFEHGSAWGQRMDLSRLAALHEYLATSWVQLTPQGRAPDLLDIVAQAQHVRLPLPFGPMLESGRLTSVVKENWNPLRYLCAIRLIQPVYAFFGGFASMERVDMMPVAPPKDPAVGDLCRAKATLATWNPVNQAGGATPQRPEPRLDGKQPAAPARAAARPSTIELPGGSTQFYIPDLNYQHFRFVDLRAEWPSVASDRGPAVPDAAFARGQDASPDAASGVRANFRDADRPDYSLLDLYKLD